MKINKISWAVALLVTGFIVAYSFQRVQDSPSETAIAQEQWQREHQLRKALISEQKDIRQLSEQLKKVHKKIRDRETELANKEKSAEKIAAKLKKYRRYNGLVSVKGKGIQIVLSDASYVPEEGNPNNYIVHEQDIQAVVYELYSIGADAVALNNQRITTFSYIECVGPVVKIDGKRYTAPFVIEAIGRPELLMNGLTMPGGIVEQLSARGITVELDINDNILMEPLYN